MNITDFLDHLHKTRGWQLDADYYSHIETWRQWWKGNVPGVHTRAAEYANGTKKRTIASLRMPKRVCEDWANLLLNDRTTFQITTTICTPIIKTCEIVGLMKKLIVTIASERLCRENFLHQALQEYA